MRLLVARCDVLYTGRANSARPAYAVGSVTGVASPPFSVCDSQWTHSKATTVVSVILGLWAVIVALTPFFPSAVVPAGVGLALGSVGRRTGSTRGWRRAATVSVGINAAAIVIVLFIALALVV